ncbi:hypothetical protein NQ315_017497 [Exocentrus adspersus]|uniref:Tc1-like transposase DDE domain-containing protein n=1 Tax=Exocentrus adspersus TaxID=1586481 RepID=A0AAV8VJK8_9CUCU|nr:hypothetical protein NQ315_017497 [Exocentrus adspersus]
MPGRAINGQSRQSILNAIDYFTREKENSGPLVSVNEVHQRVAQALQISLRTVSRTCGERQKGLPVETPGQKRNKAKKKSEDLPDGIKTSVRNTIYDMKQNGKHVTIKTINEELKRKEVVQISSFGRLLKTIGFKYKMENNRRYLCELSHVAYQRVNFLKQYYNNLTTENPLQCVYLDETWIYSKGSFKRTWQDNSIKSCRKEHEGTGKRFIILHAGSKHGFVENASLVFSSTSKSEDYQDPMNREMFEKWMTEKLLPNLEEPSLIIMDNAPYHSVLAEKLPTTSWTKSQIQEWLQQKNIQFANNCLRRFVKKHRPNERRYVVDEMINANGHQVLRLPPYHCQYNQIEHVWGICKNYYDHHIGENGYSNEEVLKTWNDALERVTPEIWANCVRHTDEIILNDWKNQIRFDEQPELHIHVGESSDDEDGMTSDED